MLDNLWDVEETPLDRVIDVYIKNIRKKLGIDCIITVKVSAISLRKSYEEAKVISKNLFIYYGTDGSNDYYLPYFVIHAFTYFLH